MNDHIADSTRVSIINRFDDYTKDKGYPDDSTLSSLPVVVLAGYFLKVHSKSPELAVLRYLNKNSISYKTSNEVKLIISALEPR